MKDELRLINWSEILTPAEHDPEEMTKILTDILIVLRNRLIPSKLITKTRHNHRNPLDARSVRQIKRKHRLWQRFLETKSGEKYNEYVRARNKVRKLTRAAQKKKEKDIASNVKTNPKQFWSYVSKKTKHRNVSRNLNSLTQMEI